MHQSVIELLQDSLQRHPPKGALLQNLLNLIPSISVDLGATIDIDVTLGQVLTDLSQQKITDDELIERVRAKYKLVAGFDPSHTANWSASDGQRVALPEVRRDETKSLRIEPPPDSVPPSLRQMINNAVDGSIWIAQDEVLNREIALKEFSATDENADYRQRQFLREAQITGQLEHPNIIPVYAVSWNQDDQPYYTMKYVEGDTLADVIDQYHNDKGHHNLRTLRPLLDVFSNVCRAIHYAHNRGVLHRDVKPSNIAIGNYGEVMVIDWGLGTTSTTSHTPRESAGDASKPDFKDPERTYRGLCEGTPNYMSPEQISHGPLTPATDIYSLGGLLFMILTGEPPRHRRFQHDHTEQMLNSVSEGDIPSPDHFNPTLPPALVSIVNRAMALVPHDRYATVGDLLTDVQSVLRDEPVTAHSENIRERVARWTRKHQFMVTIGAVAGFFGLLSLTVQTLVLDTANTQAQTALHNSRLLTTESLQQRNDLRLRNQEAQTAKRAAVYSEQEADRQRQIGKQAATAADRLRQTAARQTQRSTELADKARQSAVTASLATRNAEDSLVRATQLEQSAQLLAAQIQIDYLAQLSSAAKHLMLIGQPHEALSLLAQVITTTDESRDGIADLTDRIRLDSILSQSPKLVAIRTLDSFQVPIGDSIQMSKRASLLFSFRHSETNEPFLLTLRSQPRVTLSEPLIQPLPDIPAIVVSTSDSDRIFCFFDLDGSFTLSEFSREEIHPPTSFHIGKVVTSAISVPTTNALLLGTDEGESFMIDTETGKMTPVLPAIGTAIHSITVSPSRNLFAFAAGASVHVVQFTNGTYDTIAKLGLADRAVSLFFKDDATLRLVTESGYVNEFSSFPNPQRRIRYRPPNPGSRLRQFAVHSSGAMLLYHSSNHLTYLTPELTERTITSPNTLSIRSLAIDTTGNYAVSTTDRNTTTIWDLHTFSPRHIPLKSDAVPLAAEFIRANNQLITLHSDGSLRYWTLPQPGLGKLRYSSDKPIQACFPISTTAHTLVQTLHSVFLLDQQALEISRHTFTSPIRTLHQTDNPSLFIAATENTIFRILTENQKLTVSPLTSNGESGHLFYDTRASQLVVGTEEITIVRNEKPQTIPLPTPNSHVTGIQRIGNRDSLLISFQRNGRQHPTGMTRLDLATNTLSEPLFWNSAITHLVPIPASDEFLALGITAASKDVSFFRFAGTATRIPKTFMTVPGPVRHLAISGNGKTIAFSLANSTVHLWDLHSTKTMPTAIFVGRRVNHLGLTHMGTTLAISSGRDIQIYDVLSRQALTPPIALPQHLKQFVATDENRMLYFFGSSVMQLEPPRKDQLETSALIRRFQLLLTAEPSTNPLTITREQAVILLKTNP